jgi:hypothetical protein
MGVSNGRLSWFEIIKTYRLYGQLWLDLVPLEVHPNVLRFSQIIKINHIRAQLIDPRILLD